MEVLHEAPNLDSHVPLSTHQSRTPESFYSGPPVLYHHSPSATLRTHASDVAAVPAFSAFTEGALRNSVNGSATANGDHEAEDDQEFSISDVSVWVTSERFILFSLSLATGLSIPYPSITLHAIQHPTPSSPSSLFLQIQTASATFDDHDPDSSISISLVPSTTAVSPSSGATAPASNDEQPSDSTSALYTALSSCANLHPDPASGSEVDGEDPNIIFEGDVDQEGYTSTEGTGGLPPPMPGSGGWITAENVGDFFDEDGNWKGGGEGPRLGEGAGVVRAREDPEDGGADGNGEETKWRRTE